MSVLVPSSAVIETMLAKVLSSDAFKGRPRLRRFLTHVVLHSLAGEADSPKEYTLGVEVFQRPVSFDPRCDAIVRVEAYNLRKRLCAYYTSEGATDPITITVPKGSYRAVFHVHEEPPPAILDDPERLCTQVEWLVLHGTAEDLARARRCVQHAIRRWPGRADLHVALASTVFAALELECVPPGEAIPILRRAAAAALKIDPTRGDGVFYARIATIRGQDKSIAISGAREALQFAPTSATAHFWMGSTLFANCMIGEGAMHLQQAMRLQPYAPFFQTWFAVGLFCTGRADWGLRHLQDVLVFEPRDYLANYWLGLLSAHIGRFDEACDATRRAHQISGGSQALAALGFVEGRAGHFDHAEAIRESLVKSAAGTYVAHSALCAIDIAVQSFDRASARWQVGRAEGDWELGWARPDPRWAPLRGRVAGL